ncbi:OmpA/MotB family protein [Brevibacillus dissolubilis]|uniref:OmpA/MotB family protein n=1 Tax=Brevibacillus dissolubilis TaxID=1844116 RepID=UPI001116463E|nr:flagellar motor protein MotB [Brevibacillus dissolubilis]
MQDDRLYDEKELEKSWLLSYSDLITLLFVIVVIIAATSSSQIQVKLDEVKVAEAKQQATLKEAIESKEILSIEKLELQREIALLEARRDALVGDVKALKGSDDKTDEDMEMVKAQLATALQELNIEFEESTEGLLIRFPEKVLFTSGSAELGEDGKRAVASVAEVLTRFPYQVRIEGFTDDTPIKSSKYPSNWELSAGRAIAVMREMVDAHHIPATRFSIAGNGENKPLVTNVTPDNRALNRRVEVLIMANPE